MQQLLAELLKGSLATYINALTYPDRTVYPTASTNLQVLYCCTVVCPALPCISSRAFTKCRWAAGCFQGEPVLGAHKGQRHISFPPPSSAAGPSQLAGCVHGEQLCRRMWAVRCCAFSRLCTVTPARPLLARSLPIASGTASPAPPRLQDVVFHPLLPQDRRIFEQEGWHYSLTSEVRSAHSTTQ